MQRCLQCCWNEGSSLNRRFWHTFPRHPFSLLLPALLLPPFLPSVADLFRSLPVKRLPVAWSYLLTPFGVWRLSASPNALSASEALRDSLHWHKSKVRELIHLARQKNPTVIMSHIGVYSFNSFILFLLRKEFFQGTHSILYISHFIFHRGKKKAFPHMINPAVEYQKSQPCAGFGPSISNLASVI